MGIKSTHLVTRSEAISALHKRLLNAEDSELADALEILYSEFSHFKNYLIVESENELDEYDKEYFLTSMDFPENQ